MEFNGVTEKANQKTDKTKIILMVFAIGISLSLLGILLSLANRKETIRFNTLQIEIKSDWKYVEIPEVRSCEAVRRYVHDHDDLKHYDIDMLQKITTTDTINRRKIGVCMTDTSNKTVFVTWKKLKSFPKQLHVAGHEEAHALYEMGYIETLLDAFGIPLYDVSRKEVIAHLGGFYAMHINGFTYRDMKPKRSKDFADALTIWKMYYYEQ